MMAKTFERIRTNIKRESFLSISNIVLISITLFILGFFISLVVLSQTALRTLERQAQLSIFFKDEINESKILEIFAKIKADPRVSNAVYISKNDAYKLFTEINKDEPILLESASPSVLPASLEISAHKLSELKVLAEEFTKIEGIEEVKYFADVIEKFKFWSTLIYALGFFLIALFVLLSIAIIIAALRITIYYKKTEIEILKLVGASDSYIKDPLIYQGLFFGALAGFIACILLTIFLIVFSYLNIFNGVFLIGFFPGIKFGTLLYGILLNFIIFFFGCTLGYFGSYIAVKKYLKY